MKNVGYARVSTDDQSLDLQLTALQKAQCDIVLTDRGVSGAAVTRPGLQKALALLEPGDTLTVWRLDRLGRSLIHLVELVTELGTRQIEFRSLTECINTASSGGTLVFHMMAALAQFERSLISERTRAGMAAAKEQGKRLGRRKALSEEQQNEALAALHDTTITEVARRYNVHPRTLKRLMARNDSVGNTH